MLINVMEWNKANNTQSVVAVWGDTADYSAAIRSIVAEIADRGYAVRGNSVYYDADADAEEWD